MPEYYEEDERNQKVLDGFVDKLFTELPYKGRIRILILVDVGILKHNRFDSGYATISYDTIGQYQFLELPKDCYDVKEIGGYTKYVGAIDPNKKVVSINQGFTEDIDVGLRIFFDHNYTDSVVAYDKIFSIVKYGIENLERVKQEQKPLYLDKSSRCPVMLLTLDTAEIRRVPIYQLGFDPENLPVGKGRSIWYLVVGLGVTGVLIWFIRMK